MAVLFSLFLLFYTPAEFPYFFSQVVISSVHIYQRVRFRQFELAGFGIQVPVVCTDVYHIGDKHIMRTERNNFLHATFDAEGSLFDQRCADYGSASRSEFHLFEFTIIPSRTYSAPVGRERHVFSCQIDDELHILLDDVVGVSFRSYGYIAHGRVCTNRTRPCYCYNIIFTFIFSATHQYGRQRIDHRSRFPVLFQFNKKLRMRNGETRGW